MRWVWVMVAAWSWASVAHGEPVATPSPAPALPPRVISAQGVVVVAADAAARPDAESLARATYRRPSLRPSIDEATARVLAGRKPRSDRPRLIDLGGAVASLEDSSPAVRRRLAESIRTETSARRLLLVETSPRGVVVKVMEKGRFLPLQLVPEEDVPAERRWASALALLEGLDRGRPAPGPRTPSPAPASPAPTSSVLTVTEPEGEENETEWYESPWLWVGIGVVVAAGTTVAVLSQTTFKEPDTVIVRGAVAP